MKIVDLNTFLALPENTVFAKYKPCVFEDLSIKGATIGDDFLVQYLVDSFINSGTTDFFDTLNRIEHSGESVTMDFDSWSRDGMFEPSQLFAVWEDSDIQLLIDRLSRCVSTLAPTKP